MKKRGGLVFSTEAGRMCAGCRRPVADCVCRDRSRSRSGDGSIIVSRETKGRKGAGVTLISGLPLSDNDLKKLAKSLKSACGVGGAVKAAVIELQGDQREKVKRALEADGYTVKLSGG